MLFDSIDAVDRDGDEIWSRDIRNREEDRVELLVGAGKYPGIGGKPRC